MEEATRTAQQSAASRRQGRAHFFLAVHGGAGFHSPMNEPAYKELLSSVLVTVGAFLRDRLQRGKVSHDAECHLALMAVKRAIMVYAFFPTNILSYFNLHFR